METGLLDLTAGGQSAVLFEWLATYAVHSTLVLGGAWVLSRSMPASWMLARDVLWKTALLGALLTTSIQLGGRLDPYFGRIQLGQSPAAESQAKVVAAPGFASLESRPQAPSSPASSAPDPGPRFSDAMPAPAQGEAEPLQAGLLQAEASRAKGRDWTSVLTALWAAGAALALGRFVWMRRRLFRALGARHDLVEGPLPAMLARLCRSAGMRPRVFLTSSSRISVPIAFGTREICLPERALADLEPGQQESILAHELAHLVRRDPLWLLGSAVLESLLFFQPLQRVARRCLQQNAETLCDDWAVRRTGASLSLASCLVEVARWLHASPQPVMVATMAEGGSPLVLRIERLIEGHRPAEVPSWARRLAAQMAGLALLVGISWLAPGVSLSAADLPQDALVAEQPSSEAVQPPQPPDVPETPAAPAVPAAPSEASVPAQPALPAASDAGGSTSVSIRREDTDEETNWTHTIDDHVFSVKLRGQIEFTDDDRGISGISEDGRLRVEERGGSMRRLIEVKPDPDGRPRLAYSSSDGRGDAESWLAEVLPRILRNTGIGAEKRLNRIHASSGVEGVLEEISRIESESVKGLYFSELLKLGGLSPEQMRRLLEQSAREISSDGLKGQLYTQLGETMLAEPVLAEPYFRALGSIESDGVLGELLTKVVNREGLSQDVLLEALQVAARNIESDGVLGELLVRVAGRYLIDEALRRPFFEAVGTIDSDGVQGSVLSTLLERQDLAPEVLRQTLEAAAAGIESDVTLGSVLTLASDRFLADEDMRATYLKAAASIESDGVLGSVMSEYLKRDSLSREALLEALRIGRENIESEGVLGQFLVELIQHGPLDETLRQAIVQVADRLESTGVRAQVYSALAHREP